MSAQLAWVEYVHNSLTSSATGLSSFEASLAYQPRLFPAVDGEHEVPSVQHYLSRCRHLWKTNLADQCRNPAPPYKPGQKVWLTMRYVLVQTDSRKLSPNL